MTAREAYEAYDRPLCECHGEPMRWHMDMRRSAGGYWQCAEKQRESDRRYYEAIGWYKRRLRDLKSQRADILKRLAELDQWAFEIWHPSGQTP